MFTKIKIRIGIDPDTVKSGVAQIDKETKQLLVSCMTFFDLYDYLRQMDKETTKVFIEAGWLNVKKNWHYSPKYQTMTKESCISMASSIGAKVGANHEVGRKIVEMCYHLGLQYDLLVPKTQKVDDKYFKQLTNTTGKTNQEERDAAMLIIGR
jgi:hypothetical protein